MRRPDVFTLDYSHPLAHGLVFAGLTRQGVIRNGAPYYDSSIMRQPAVGVNTSNSEFLPEINRGAHVFSSASSNAIDMGAGLPSSGPLSFGLWVWTNTTNSMAMSSRTGTTTGFELLTGGGGVRGEWLWRSTGGNAPSYGVDDTVAHHCAFVLVNVASVWKIQAYLDGSFFSEQTATTSSLGQSQNPHLARRGGSYWTGKIADPVFYNRSLSPAEIALLADRTDPMLGGLIVEERPVLYFDMGGGTEVEGPAVITAASTIAASGSKQAVSPATVTASASVGMGGVKGAVAPLNIVGSISTEASGIKSTSSPATITTASAYGASGIKTIAGLDKEGPAVITASATVGMGGVKGGVGAAVLGGDYAPTAGGAKGAAGQAWFAATCEFYAVRGPDEVPITTDEIGRAVSLQARNYSAVLAKRNYTARL